MNRRNRMMIVLVVAVLLASFASYLVYRAIREMPVREVEVASVQVAVAAENLPVGTMLMKEHVKTVGWPASSPVQGSFASPEDVLNRGLIQPVGMNEPITESKLAPVEAGAGLPPSIIPGMRAVSVRVNQVIGVAGFVLAGTRVDVLVTLNDRTESLTRAVASNVQVLSADQRYDTEQARQGNAQPSSVVTLLLTPEDAERITLAQSVGSLMLTLRNPLDTAPTETQGARIRSLLGEPPPPPVIRRSTGGRPRAVTPKPAAPPPTRTIETIRAGKKTTQVLDNGGAEDNP